MNNTQNDTQESFKTLQQVTEEHFRKALEVSGGNKPKAAKLLDVSVKTIYNFLNNVKVKTTF